MNTFVNTFIVLVVFFVLYFAFTMYRRTVIAQKQEVCEHYWQLYRVCEKCKLRQRQEMRDINGEITLS